MRVLFMATRQRNHAGFTLLELLCVVTILALTATAASLAIRSGTRLDLRAAAQELAGDLGRFRQAAILRQQITIVSSEDLKEQLRAIGKKGSRFGGLEVSLRTDTPKLLDPGANTLRFFPDGSSTGGMITLSSGNADLSIRIDAIDGRADIDD